MIPSPGSIVVVKWFASSGKLPIVGVVTDGDVNAVSYSVEAEKKHRTLRLYPAATRPEGLEEVKILGNDNKLAALLHVRDMLNDELSHAETEYIRKQFARYTTQAHNAYGLPA